MNKSVAIITNSKECTRHIQYYATLENYLTANNFSVKDDFQVDKVLICACGFHDFMFNKVQNTLNALKSINFPEESIVILGCLPKTHQPSIAKAFRGPVIPFGQEYLLDNMLNADIPFNQIQPTNIFRLEPDEPPRDLFFIKIAQGCFGKCTFCVINKAKGPLRSESPEAILRLFQRGLQNGRHHFFLMGEDTFAYGLDIGTTIIELTRALIDKASDAKFSFGSLHIKWLESYAEDILALCQGGYIEHLHIGLQHVNERILKRMGRLVPFQKIYRSIKKIKTQCPDVIVSGDVMVGFPGENEKIFNELMAFFQEDTSFDQISHFGYSDVKGAPASNFDEKVDPLQVAYRWDRLRLLLGPRSYYNNSTRSVDQRNQNYRKAFIATFESDFAFCMGSHVNIPNRPE